MAIPAAVPVSSSSRPAAATVAQAAAAHRQHRADVDRRLGFLDRDHGQVGGGDPLLTVEPAMSSRRTVPTGSASERSHTDPSAPSAPASVTPRTTTSTEEPARSPVTATESAEIQRTTRSPTTPIGAGAPRSGRASTRARPSAVGDDDARSGDDARGAVGDDRPGVVRRGEAGLATAQRERPHGGDRHEGPRHGAR